METNKESVYKLPSVNIVFFHCKTQEQITTKKSKYPSKYPILLE